MFNSRMGRRIFYFFLEKSGILIVRTQDEMGLIKKTDTHFPFFVISFFFGSRNS